MTSFKQKMLFVGICLLFTVFQSVVGLAVMSVDIGSEWMKVAIVSPGVPMEVVLNRESQRKTPVAVAFRDGERVFGDPALSIGVRFPDKCFMYLMDIIGKQIDNPLVELYQKRFPYYKMDATEDRKSIKFTHPEGMEFTVEELIAMILKQAQQIAEKHAGQPIKDAVITVPAFFNQAERRAMLQAAKLSGLNVLQLINSNTAVALNYGVFRRKDFNETPTNILFYDMGAGSTVATVVSYQLVKSKETGEVSPQLSVKGVGFDHTLGGLEMQLRLRDTFASAFNKEKKTSNDVLKNNRAMAKLFKEAGRVKKVLSANTEHVAQVESLLDDKDFRFPISRAEFEELLKDLFVRVTEPVETALKSAYIDMNLIDQVILSGSGARVPMVQQILLDFIKKELGKSLNTDESAALGAAYQAAHLSKGFKVKTFLVKDANIFPIQVDFQREYELEDKTTGIKTVKRILFSRNNGIPMKKIMTFNRHVKDFEFYVNYGDDLKTFLNDFQLRALGSPNISKVSLSGVEATIGKHMGEKTEYKGVKAHFRVDESGILNLDEVESVFEKTEEETAESKLESAFNKLGSTLGRLFSGSSEEETKGEKPEESNDSKTDESKDSKKEDEKAQNVTKEGEKNATEPKKQMKLVTIKEPLVSAQEYLDLPNLSDGSIKESVKKLKDLDEHDRARLAKAKAKNSLESFIVDTKDKLNRDEYIKASTDDERNSMLQKLNEAGDWLEYESDDATTTDVYKGKLKELSTLTQSLFERVQEHIHRPDAVKTLNEMINISQVFLASARNMSEDEQIFTEVELQTLETLITETNKWLEESVAEQNTLSLSVTPKLTMKMLGEKIMALDREVKYLLNKKRFAQPLKKKPAKKETVNETEQNTTEQEKVATESTTGETESSNDQEVKPLDVPDLENSNTEETTTVKDSINPSPSPDTVKEDDHSEL